MSDERDRGGVLFAERQDAAGGGQAGGGAGRGPRGDLRGKRPLRATGWLSAGRDAALGRPTTLVSAHSLAGRKLLVLGMPVWASKPPPPIGAYLGAVDTAGVKVAAFATYDGGGAKATLAKLAEIIPGGLIETLEIKKPRERDAILDAMLAEWARRVKALATG